MNLTFDPEKHEYRLNNIIVPSVTQILLAEGFIDTTWFTDYGRKRGKLVHRLIEWHLSGELDEESIDPVLRPYYDAWVNFEKDTGFESEVIEKLFASETYRFAGTPDMIGCLNGHNAILDIKTGVVQPWTALQLAAYEILVKHPSIERFALRLKDDGKYKLTQHKDRQDRGVFLAALSIYYWKANNRM